MCKIATYSESASIISSLRSELPAVIIANAILWAAALFAVSSFEGRPHFLTTASFAALWFISNITLYAITQRVRK
jgi:ABC-type multidrug transport system permease subunit